MSGAESELSNPFLVTIKASPHSPLQHVKNVTEHVHKEVHSTV